MDRSTSARALLPCHRGPRARPTVARRQGDLQRLQGNTHHLDPAGPGHDDCRTAGSGCPQRCRPGVTSP